jgi:siroheme synthase
MDTDIVEVSTSPRNVSPCGCGCVFLLGSSLADHGELAPPALAALAAADAVLHDSDADPRILALAPHGAFVEKVRSYSGRKLANTAGTARAHKLASEGWCVVWIISGDIAPPAARCAEAGLAPHTHINRSAGGPETTGENAYSPRTLATAFNGLAG